MAFGTQKRGRGFATGGTVDITVSGQPAATPAPFIAAQSSIPAPTAAQIAKYPQLPAATPPAAQPFTPQPYSNAMSQVPVGGTSGVPNSASLGQIGANGVPSGQTMAPNITAAQSSLNRPGVAATPAAAPVAAAPVDPIPLAPIQHLINNQSPGVSNQVPGVSNQVSARGGTIHRKMATGGAPTSSESMPFYARSEVRGALQPQGLVRGMAGGRTDVHPINVPSGSYVLPADVVSGLGEGNTLAGSSVIDKMMSTMPYGIKETKMGRGAGPPRAPAPPKTDIHAYGQIEGEPGIPLKARGGSAQKKEQHGTPVPIVVAGGEHILYPQTIIQKFGSLKKGHEVLDKFVLGARKQTIGDMRKLKGPKK